MPSAAPPDAIFVPEKTGRYHFGEVFQGETIQTQFTIYNPAPYPINIVRVENTCGCTSTRLEGERIGPRQQRILRVELDTKSLWGPQSKAVIVHTNDPYRQRVRLTLEGVVRTYLVCEPRRLVAKKIEGRHVERVRIVNTSDQPLELTSATVFPACPHVQAHFPQAALPISLEAGDSTVLEVEAVLAKKGVRITGEIQITTQHPFARAQIPFFFESPPPKRRRFAPR